MGHSVVNRSITRRAIAGANGDRLAQERLGVAKAAGTMLEVTPDGEGLTSDARGADPVRGSVGPLDGFAGDVGITGSQGGGSGDGDLLSTVGEGQRRRRRRTLPHRSRGGPPRLPKQGCREGAS